MDQLRYRNKKIIFCKFDIYHGYSSNHNPQLRICASKYEFPIFIRGHTSQEPVYISPMGHYWPFYGCQKIFNLITKVMLTIPMPQYMDINIVIIYLYCCDRDSISNDAILHCFTNQLIKTIPHKILVPLIILFNVCKHVLNKISSHITHATKWSIIKFPVHNMLSQTSNICKEMCQYNYKTFIRLVCGTTFLHGKTFNTFI